MNEPNSFGDPEFLKKLKLINDPLSEADSGQDEAASQKRSELNQLADLATHTEKEVRLNRAVEQACLVTGATGAAIALVQGQKIVCCASSGPGAPDIGVSLDPHNGLSGACIQTRQLQQCTDTERDQRVDPVASRSLGVRSIVVFPLIEGAELFGIFEVLSSRPNAFSQGDFETLQALTDEVVRSRRQNWEAKPTAPPAFAPKVAEFVPQDKSRSPRLDSVFPRRKRISRTADLTVAILGLLVIASAVTLGTLVGWRIGWQRATLALRAISPRYRTTAPSKTGQVGRTVLPANQARLSSARLDECGQTGPAGPQTQPLSGGLTVCQEGRIIFSLPASASATGNLRVAQRSPVLPTDPKQK